MFILTNFEKWNDFHGYVEGELSPEVEEGLKIYSEPARMLLPNSFSGKFDIPVEVITVKKGFDFDHLLNIFVRLFSSANKSEIKSTKTFQILENSLSNTNIDLQKILDKQFNSAKGAKNFGNYSSDVEAY